MVVVHRRAVSATRRGHHTAQPWFGPKIVCYSIGWRAISALPVERERRRGSQGGCRRCCCNTNKLPYSFYPFIFAIQPYSHTAIHLTSYPAAWKPVLPSARRLSSVRHVARCRHSAELVSTNPPLWGEGTTPIAIGWRRPRWACISWQASFGLQLCEQTGKS